MVVNEWERCAPWLKAALDGTHTLEDVLHEVERGRAQFWPLDASAVVTVVHQYPRGKRLRVWLAGGDLDELVRYLPAADEFARRSGCDGVEIEGRKGWERVLKDYRCERVVLTKEL